tara:strand:+ start:948 stop:1208 length:261 start_codon:yes stop_codon:yes gene_type:complete
MSRKVVEYRIHWGSEGDSHDIEFVEGKNWRYAKEVVRQCEDGAIPYCDVTKLSIQWIERVVDTWCEFECSVIDSEYDILWEQEESE